MLTLKPKIDQHNSKTSFCNNNIQTAEEKGTEEINILAHNTPLPPFRSTKLARVQWHQDTGVSYHTATHIGTCGKYIYLYGPI